MKNNLNKIICLLIALSGSYMPEQHATQRSTPNNFWIFPAFVTSFIGGIFGYRAGLSAYKKHQHKTMVRREQIKIAAFRGLNQKIRKLAEEDFATAVKESVFNNLKDTESCGGYVSRKLKKNIESRFAALCKKNDLSNLTSQETINLRRNKADVINLLTKVELEREYHLSHKQLNVDINSIDLYTTNWLFLRRRMQRDFNRLNIK